MAAIVAMLMPFPKVADPVLWVSSMAGLTGIASFAMLILRLIWSSTERKSVLAALIPASLLPLYILSAQNILIIAQAMHATTLDLYLFKFDGSLGFQPSFWVGSLFIKSFALKWVCLLVYYSLPLAMGVAYAASADVRQGTRSWYTLSLFVVAGLLGWAFYNFFPATGPRFVFGADFPRFSLPYSSLPKLVVEPIRIAQTIPRNAMPSLHMTWVLLIWWNLRRTSVFAGMITFLYVLLTALGTLGIGEHYLIDLIVAFPFALMVQSVCMDWSSRSEMRWVALFSGLALTLIWNVVLKHPEMFLVSRVLPWAAILATLLITDFVRRRTFVRVKGRGIQPSEFRELELGTATSAEDAAMPYTQTTR
jgi:hypothetical protein